MWLKNFIPSLRVIDNISKALTIYCDNKAAVSSHIIISQLALPSTLT
jgi:hypothetical protein